MAMSRSLGGRSFTRWSPIMMSSEVASSSPAIMRSAVVLPQPDEPTSTANSPCWMSSDKSLTARTAPNCLTTFFSVTDDILW